VSEHRASLWSNKSPIFKPHQ
jgi:putative SOS response-associated peptidase YedK